MQRMPVLAPLATVILLGSSTAYAQLPNPSTLVPPPTLVNGILTIGTTVIQPDDAATAEELPGIGHKFELFGVMMQDTDPENAVGNSGNSGGGGGGNETISAVTTPTTLAFAYRSLPPGIGIKALTNQIGLKYYFVGARTCAAGSPRVTLLVDSDGDGDTDFAAHGHVNPGGNYTACPMNMWTYEDLTDLLPRWEVTGASVPGIIPNAYMPWKAFAAAITAAFPAHKVRAGFLIDGESCNFAPSLATCGKAYYDLFTLENRTLEIWQDAVKKQ
jgi:hypothetical protein